MSANGTELPIVEPTADDWEQKVERLQRQLCESKEFVDAAYEDAVHFQKAAVHLYRLGRDMRQAQKDFFKSKRPSQLRRARELERQFDAALSEWRGLEVFLK